MSSPFRDDGRLASLTLHLLAGAALATLAVGPALAQAAAGASTTAQAPLAEPPVEESDDELDGLVVSAQRSPPGSVIGDIAPELVLTPRDIQAYGAASVSELLDALAPQTASAQGSGGRPVTLINGARVSGFAEIRDLPTEAIARVDILPEEVALKYGYPAEQKVVNLVLRQRFRAKLVEGTASAPTQGGGGDNLGGHGSLLRIQRGLRTTLDARVTQSNEILESDRDILGGEGEFRSLQPQSTTVALNGVLARPLGDRGVSGSVNGLFESTDSESRLGLSPFGTEALLRNAETRNAQLSGSLAGAYKGWTWSSTAQLQRNQSNSTTDRAFNGLAYIDRTQSIASSAQADVVANRSLFFLPAGRVTTTLTARASTTDLVSQGQRLGAFQFTELGRSIGQVAGNVDLPITAADDGLGKVIGKLSANLNLGHQELSDFGGVDTLGGGLNWTPVKPLRVIASYTQADQAPSINQLGDPVVATPGVRVFDLSRGQTVEITRVTGGNQALDAGERNTFKLGATYKPFTDKSLTFQANYVSTRNENVIAAFPSASTQVEAAFPDRFVRDGTGALVQIDARPVNFARQSRDELRWGFTYSKNLGPQPTPDQLAAFRRRGEGGGAADGQRRDGQASLNAQGQNAQGQAARGQGGRAQDGQGQQRRNTQDQASGNPGPPDGPPPGDAPPPGPPPGGFAGGPRGPGGPGGGRGGFGGFGGGGPRGGVLQIGLYHTIVFRDEILIRPGTPVLDLLDGSAIGAGGGTSRHQVDLQANVTRRGLGAALNARWQSATSVAGSIGQDDLAFSDFTTVNLRLFADLGQQPMARIHPFLRGARATLSIDNLFDERQQVRTSAGVVPISYQPDLLDPVGRSVKLTFRKLFFTGGPPAGGARRG